MRALYVRKWPAMHKQPQIQLPDKNKGIDVLQSQALYTYRTCYQASITSYADLTRDGRGLLSHAQNAVRWLTTKAWVVADLDHMYTAHPVFLSLTCSCCKIAAKILCHKSDFRI